MKHQLLNIIKLLGLTLGIALSIFLTTFVAFADWTQPPSTPPTCPAGEPGCETPVHVGVGGQAKEGPFGVGGVFQTLSATYLATDSGNVGIGTSSPGAKLDVGGEVKMTDIPWTGSDIPTLLLLGHYSGSSQRLSGSFYGFRSSGSSALTNFQVDVVMSVRDLNRNFSAIVQGYRHALSPIRFVSADYNGQTWLALAFDGTTAHYQPHRMGFVGNFDGLPDGALRGVPVSEASNIANVSGNNEVSFLTGNRNFYDSNGNLVLIIE